MSDAWRIKLKRVRQGKRILTESIIENVNLILENEWEGCLQYDVFANRTALVKLPPKGGDFQLGPWTDDHTTKLLVWLGNNYHIHMNVKAVRATVSMVARRNEVHPVRDWLDGLKWDGKPRLDGWLTRHAGADASLSYIAVVLSKWLIAAVARVYRPGCQADNVLVLEGRKGVGKTSFFRILGGSWYTPMPYEMGSQNSYMNLWGKLIVELPELSAVKRAADIERVKAFITQPVDPIRVPYGHDFQDYPRQCVIGGSTNDSEWIQEFDERRWWPVSVEDIDMVLLRRDRDQLFAEAKHRFQAGESWHITDAKVLKSISEGVENVAEVDPWEGRIVKDLVVKGMTEVTSDYILTNVIGVPREKVGRFDQMRVSKVLKRLGFKRLRIGNDQARRYVYRRQGVLSKDVGTSKTQVVTQLFDTTS